MINFAEFIERYYPNSDDNQVRYYKQLYARFEEIIADKNDIPRDIKAYTPMFIPQYKTIATKVFYLVRQFLINMFEYIEETEGLNLSDIHGRMIAYRHEDILNELYDNKYYFKSLEDLNEYFDRAADSVGDNTKSSVIMIRCMALLCWYGMTPKEIVSIQKSGMDDDSKSIIVGDCTYAFDDNVYKYLKQYKMADGYCDYSGDWKNYNIESTYLFRGARSLNFDNKTLARWLYLFNIQFKDIGKIIDTTHLRINSKYVYIYERCRDRVTDDIFEAAFNDISARYRCKYKAMYKLWLKANYKEVN